MLKSELSRHIYENKELQERLFQAEKQIIYLATMQQRNVHSPQSIQSSEQKLNNNKKHFKTLSLKDSMYQLTMNDNHSMPTAPNAGRNLQSSESKIGSTEFLNSYTP